MKYAREMLRDVAPYVPGEQPSDPRVIKLNTNENPYPPSPKVLEAIRALPETALRKYPDMASVSLREACAKRYGYEGPEWVIAGNGMDELLAMAIRTFVDPGDDVLTVYPTYVIYETLAALHGANLKYTDLTEDFQLPESFFGQTGRLCFLTRPNAPSGVSASREAVERLCESFDGLVVIDEAYADFADDDCMDFPKRYENAVVMRTLSKAFGLAGLRVGVAVARPEIIGELMKTKDSYNVNAASQAAAVAALDDYDYMLGNATKIRETRNRLTGALRNRGFDVPESQTNFVLAKRIAPPSARDILGGLRERNIFVRYFDARRLDDALRISIGTDEECDALVTALDEILENS